MKRADLTTYDVLTAVREHRFSAFEQRAEKYPAKVVRAAIARDVGAGLLEYGVSADRPWLSPAGEHQLEVGGPDGGERTCAEGSGAPAAP